ncbi:MAG: hypothetical protein J6Y80_01655 [Victivallales bacterium]|nr:hypothetical protein [Victivallales bacterium]
MIQDVYEPLEKYQNEFREAFAKNASEEFERLVRASGVDSAANRHTCRELYQRETERTAALASRVRWRFGGFFIWVLIVAGIILAAWPFIPQDWLDYGFWQEYIAPTRENWYFFTGGGAALAYLLFVFYWKVVRRKLAGYAELLERLLRRIEELRQEAWRQLAPLNALYDWDIAPRLIQKTVPRLEFDPFFTQGRLAELHRNFGWDDSFNSDKSVLGSQSGVINGNPFVFGRFLGMHWGETTYHGYLDISWTERVKDSKGNWHTVTRHERLHASVTKPSPVYTESACVLYGNDAAPSLTFTHKPTGIAGKDDLLSRLKKRREFKKLKKFSENLEDESQYTMMSNHDFEVLFHADDRNDEVEFRLLFTPLAQIQMLKLLEDTQVGFGDDFTFVKQHKINALFPRHLQQFSLDTDPRQFHDFDLERARRNFQSRQEQFFKHAYFGLAPLLSIPLYQQLRTHENIYGDILSRRACFWEHEALANYCGEGKFAHPQCVTRNLLKTRVASREKGTTSLAVTAYGYRTVKHVTYISKWGGDGRTHQVPVEWLEYLPVERTSELLIAEQESPSDGPHEPPLPGGQAVRWSELLAQVGRFASPVGVRRSILAFFRR